MPFSHHLGVLIRRIRISRLPGGGPKVGSKRHAPRGPSIRHRRDLGAKAVKRKIKPSRMMMMRESSSELRDGARAGSGLEAATTAVKAHSIWIMHVH